MANCLKPSTSRTQRARFHAARKRRTMRFLFYALLLATSPGVRAGQSTKPPAVSLQDNLPDRTVDLAEHGEPLDKVLARISVGTGPKLTVNGETSWERISAHAHNCPLRSVMSD